jgi:hypothetical protein
VVCSCRFVWCSSLPEPDSLEDEPYELDEPSPDDDEPYDDDSESPDVDDAFASDELEPDPDPDADPGDSVVFGGMVGNGTSVVFPGIVVVLDASVVFGGSVG